MTVAEEMRKVIKTEVFICLCIGLIRNEETAVCVHSSDCKAHILSCLIITTFRKDIRISSFRRHVCADPPHTHTHVQNAKEGEYRIAKHVVQEWCS